MVIRSSCPCSVSGCRQTQACQSAPTRTITGSFTPTVGLPGNTTLRSPEASASGRSASSASIHQCFDAGVAQLRYSRQRRAGPSAVVTSAGRSNEAAPKSSR